jgi:hypothetical protein
LKGGSSTGSPLKGEKDLRWCYALASRDISRTQAPFKMANALSSSYQCASIGPARWFRPYPPQTPTQRPPVRVLPLPILTTTAYLGSKLRFLPTSFTSSYVLGRTRQPSVTCNAHSMEAGREQRMIEIDRAPRRVCSKVRGLSLATSCHRARLYQVRGRPRGHEDGLRLLDFGPSRSVIFRVTSSCA